MAASTIECYTRWVRQFLAFHRQGDEWVHPRNLGAAHVEAFLNHLVQRRLVSASTQNQAINAIVYFYRHALEGEIAQDHLGKFVAERSKRPVRTPTVLSEEEVRRLISVMEPASVMRLMVELLYGTGLRVMEACSLRISDVDFDRRQIIVRAGKGQKDRRVMMPGALVGKLADRSRAVRHIYEKDLEKGGGFVAVCTELSNKAAYSQRDFRWQFLFANSVLHRDEQQRGCRWHTHPGIVAKAVREAAVRAKIDKRVTPHTFRHTFATHLLEAGYDVRQVQTLLGHERLETTMIYTHVMNRPAISVCSPLDRMVVGR